MAAFPNAAILSNGLTGFKAGSNWATPFTGIVDAFTIGVTGSDTTSNFEPVASTTDTTAPAAPMPVSPAHGATTTTEALDKVDWTDVTDPSSPVTYIYEVSNSPATTTDGSFVTP